MPELYWNTVNDLLQEVLTELMGVPEFSAFRLVGGTSLSLQIGHRMSMGIDLFTDATYDTIDFAAIDQFFRDRYDYVETNGGLIGTGTSYFIGQKEDEAVKVDLYYTDPFLEPEIEKDGIRLASVAEIIAMKMDVVSRGGRKKDFWDLHALIDLYSLNEMVRLHEQRYPYTHDENLIRKNVLQFDEADDDFDPICLQAEYWELIKYDLVKWAGR